MAYKIYEVPEMRERLGVFRDRKHAGQVLAAMLNHCQDSNAIILGIPSGGIPVAVEIAHTLNLPLDVAVVSKILLPWNTEAGFGAVAFDGTVWINRDYVNYYRMGEAAVKQQTHAAIEKVKRRIKLFRDDRPWPDFSKKTVILVDDGIAAGSTIRVAIKALNNTRARKIVVAVPTAHLESLDSLTDQVDSVYCPNIRSGSQFAVAAAYLKWDDVDETEAKRMLDAFSKT